MLDFSARTLIRGPTRGLLPGAPRKSSIGSLPHSINVRLPALRAKLVLVPVSSPVFGHQGLNPDVRYEVQYSSYVNVTSDGFVVLKRVVKTESFALQVTHTHLLSVSHMMSHAIAPHPLL